MTDGDWDHINQIAEKITHTFNSIAPQALHTTLEVVRISSIQHLFHGFVFMFFAILVTAAVFFGYKYAEKNSEPSPSEDDGWLTLLMIGVVLALIFFIISLVTLCDLWNWVGAFNPQLEFAHKITEKVLEDL